MEADGCYQSSICVFGPKHMDKCGSSSTSTGFPDRKTLPPVFVLHLPKAVDVRNYLQLKNMIDRILNVLQCLLIFYG